MALSPIPTEFNNGAWLKPSFRHLLQKTDIFVTCAELVTSRGVITERRGRRVLELARELAQHPRIDALSITDNPGGNAMISADILGTDLISRGQDVIIHLSCKDWNRNALQSRAWQLSSAGFNNILALTGDYPTGGYQGLASGVFDLDSVSLLKMFSDMNSGMAANESSNTTNRKMEQTRFFLGAVVNNHKRYERELMPQYFKLAKKIEAGAGFVINQIGYDSRKQDELLRYMALHQLQVPVIANVYVLSLTAARFFHAGKVPGCVVTDKLLELVEQRAKSPDQGKQFFLELAAKQCAVAKGLGFRGAYLGGHLKAEDYDQILNLADGFADNDWKDLAREIQFSQFDEFYLFERDSDSCLNSNQLNDEYLRSKSPEGRQRLKERVPASYRINRTVHNSVFEKGSFGFSLGSKLMQSLEQAGAGVMKAAHAIEQTFKIIAFDCHDCGDCSLPEIAYLCPESQCAKNQRNGPCGGTRQGQCEVGEKQCIWALAYDRLKAYGEEERMLDRPVVIKDAALKGSSAWANALLERDHRSRK